MEKEKKFDIFKMVIIIACVISFIGLLLPYESSIGEYKEYLQENPDTINVKEVNLTNKDVVDISMIENFKVYSYAMNNSEGNSWLSGESTINFVLTIVLIASIVLVLLFTLFNKRILSMIFGMLLLGSSLLMNYDIVDRGVIPSTQYTYGISYYLYPIMAIIERLKERGISTNDEILFVGTQKGLESRIVPAAGVNFKTIKDN